MRDPVLVAALPEGGSRRPGASCSTATTRASTATRCSPRACRAAATASSATSNTLTGLAGLPSGGHIVVAPYVTAQPRRRARATALGTPLRNDAGRRRRRRRRQVDAHREHGRRRAPSTPTSRRSSPTSRRSRPTSASRSSSPRSARSSSKGVDLLLDAHPGRLHAHDHRRRAGALRGTGKSAHTAYTALVAEDRRRRQRDPARPERLRTSRTRTSARYVGDRRGCGATSAGPFVSAAGHRPRDRSGGGYNRVFGPDFQWRPSARDTVTGQFLFSRPRTPNRPDLADGVGRAQSLAGHAARSLVPAPDAKLRLVRRVPRLRRRLPRRQRLRAPGRATARATREAGYTFRPAGIPAPHPPFAIADVQDGPRRRPHQPRVLVRRGHGRALELVHALPLRLHDAMRAGEVLAARASACTTTCSASPSRWLSDDRRCEGFVGEEIDFDNAPRGHGRRRAPLRHRCARPITSSCGSTTSRRWLDVDPPGRAGRAALHRPGRARARDLHVHVPRRSCARIGQYVDTRRDPSLYIDEVDRPRRRASAAPRSSPTSSTGRRCCSSATATTGALSEDGDARARGPPVLPEAVVRLPALSGG